MVPNPPSSSWLEIPVGEGETVFGFIPAAHIKAGQTPDRGLVRAVVLHAVNGKVAVLFRGDILSQSSPVVVPPDLAANGFQVSTEAGEKPLAAFGTLRPVNQVITDY
jgi:hypothetical protein